MGKDEKPRLGAMTSESQGLASKSDIAVTIISFSWSAMQRRIKDVQKRGHTEQTKKQKKKKKKKIVHGVYDAGKLILKLLIFVK